MTRYRVATPAAGHTGEVAGVAFAAGFAEIDVPAVPQAREGESRDERLTRERALNHPLVRALAYFRAQGYGVEEVTSADKVSAAPVPPPARNASTEEWRAYAKASGMPAGAVDTMSRDQLVAHYTPQEA